MQKKQQSNLFGGLPLGQLRETLLTSPDGGVNDFQEELTGARVKDEDGTIDRLRRQITLECLQRGSDRVMKARESSTLCIVTR